MQNTGNGGFRHTGQPQNGRTAPGVGPDGQEAAQQAGELHPARILEAAAEGILILDMAGRISYANSHAEQILGFTRSELFQRPYNDPGWQLTGPDGSPLMGQNLSLGPVMQGKPVAGLEYGITRGDGTRAVVSVAVSPVRDPQDGMGFLVISLRDVTTERRSNTALVRLRREVRAELERIRESAGSLCAGPLNTDQHQQAARILAAAERLLQAVDQAK